MAQFRGTVEGTRGDASRLGSKASGLRVTANGWTVGADVTINHEDGKDVVRVWQTTGSAGDGRRKLIAEYSELEF